MLKVQRLLIGLFIILIPLIYPLHEVLDARAFQQTIFQFGVMIIAVFFVRNLWLALFFCLTVFLYYINGCTVGKETVLNVFYGIVLYGISRQIFSKFKFEKETKWFLYLGLISLGFMILQVFCIDPLHITMTNDGKMLPYTRMGDLVGIMNLKSHNGIYFALLVPIMALANPLFGILTMVPVVTSESSGAVLAGGLALLFFLWFTKKTRWFIITCLIGLLGIGAFFIKDFKASPHMFGSRLGIWHLTVKQCLFRPIGYGPDSFRNTTPHKNFMIMGDQDFHTAIGYTTNNPNAYQFVYYDPDQSKMDKINTKGGYELKAPNLWDHPHNEYLNLLFCWGFGGLILFGLLMRDSITKFIKCEKSNEIVLVTSMLIVFLISSLVQFPMSVARLGYLAPLLLGAFDASMDSQGL